MSIDWVLWGRHPQYADGGAPIKIVSGAWSACARERAYRFSHGFIGLDIRRAGESYQGGFTVRAVGMTATEATDAWEAHLRHVGHE